MPRTAVSVLIRKTFQNPPILVGEDPADYQQLKDWVIEEVNPLDLTQVLLTRDIVDAEWEILRLRGLKPGVIHAMIPRAVKKQILDASEEAPLDPSLVPSVRRHVVAMIAGQLDARAELESMLCEHELTLDIIQAAAFAEAIGPQVHIDRMITAAGERRNAAYAELDRLRLPDLAQGAELEEAEDKENELAPG